ncbi:MAG TPA: hypothetical protein VKA08_15370, partial [Balneolales bacterium]|nr:hypothetical protein [Balneolales bacterium]
GLFKDTTLRFSRTFGNHLFQVDSKVRLRGRQVWDDLSLHQLRDVKLNVVTTQEAHNKYVLTYVNSPDLESLHYKSVTSLKPEKRFPWFWVGLGSGLVISAMTWK